jgi:hypothetical protein
MASAKPSISGPSERKASCETPAFEFHRRERAGGEILRPWRSRTTADTTSSGAVSSSAGLITATATGSRQIQFGLKLIF